MTYDVQVTQQIKVTLDITKFTPEFMADFRRSFYPFDTVEEHAEHIGQMVARAVYPEIFPGDDTFIEGYGPANEMGITAVAGWIEIETEIDN
jgi:hypothetical protein